MKKEELILKTQAYETEIRRLKDIAQKQEREIQGLINALSASKSDREKSEAEFLKLKNENLELKNFSRKLQQTISTLSRILSELTQ